MLINDIVQALPSNYMVCVYDSIFADAPKRTVDDAMAWFAAGTYQSITNDILSKSVVSMDFQARQNTFYLTIIVNISSEKLPPEDDYGKAEPSDKG